MWRYISGVSKPAKKKQTEDEKQIYFKNYESEKRSRRFDPEWQTGRPWLQDSHAGLICSVCTEFGTDRTSVYVKGCKAYKLDSVRKHESSKQHTKNALIAAAKSKSKAESAAGKLVLKLNAAVVDKLSKMFRNCHALVIKNRPISDFDWLCDLDDMKGLNLGQTYRNNEAAKMFIKSIAELEFQRVSSKIQESKFVCFIGDGSTDSAVKEQEMWYIRTCVQGVISINFVGVHAAERADASSIVEV